MLHKSLCLNKCTSIQFDLQIVSDKKDMNMFQNIKTWLRKPSSLYVLNVANEKKKASNNALAIT